MRRGDKGYVAVKAKETRFGPMLSFELARRDRVQHVWLGLGNLVQAYYIGPIFQVHGLNFCIQPKPTALYPHTISQAESNNGANL